MISMITRIKYLVLLTLVGLYNTLCFAQMVGTPYAIPTTSGSNITALTFSYKGEDQTWEVPAGVTEIYVDVVGAQGTTIVSRGGAGGRVLCKIPVTTGQILYLTVGGTSTNNIAVYGGGGNGGTTSFGTKAGAGGGMSAISSAFPLSHANAIVIAAGGGGGNNGYSPTSHGGGGGGTDGSKGIGGFAQSQIGGDGGTQTNGGAGGIQYDSGVTAYASAGSPLKGGNGGSVVGLNVAWNGGGGGGAGYYGGGGGAGGGAAQGGGGGGSSWINSSLTLPGALNMGNVNTSGHGKITIYY